MERPEPVNMGYRLPLAVLSLLAAGVHIALAPEHFEEWWGYGGFFLVAGATQAGYGLAWLVFRPELPQARTVILGGILLNLFLVALYLITRTAGIPWFGPHAWEVEPITYLDMLAKSSELLLVCVLVAAWQKANATAS